VFRWKLYSRQRESCWLERHADWDCCCSDIGAKCLRDVGYASDHDRAIGARDIGVEMRTIGRVASLGLVVLLWWSDHDEAAFGFVEVVIGIQVRSRCGRTAGRVEDWEGWQLMSRMVLRVTQ
jgi:hypothetical protein